MGAGEAGAFPASYALFGKWVPKAERSRSIAGLLSGLPLGTLFALAVTGPVIEAFGWEAIFYLFGALGIIFAVFWLKLIYETPREHPQISKEELALIEADKSDTHQTEGVPVKKILKNKAVWALIINHFCSNWIFYVLLAWLPSYFSDALGVDVKSAGFFSICLLYTSPSPRDRTRSRMPSSA